MSELSWTMVDQDFAVDRAVFSGVVYPKVGGPPSLPPTTNRVDQAGAKLKIPYLDNFGTMIASRNFLWAVKYNVHDLIISYLLSRITVNVSLNS